jgi:hypothetical protein
MASEMIQLQMPRELLLKTIAEISNPVEARNWANFFCGITAISSDPGDPDEIAAAWEKRREKMCKDFGNMRDLGVLAHLEILRDAATREAEKRGGLRIAKDSILA